MAKTSIVMKDIERPNRFEASEESATYGRYEIEPFMRGFGMTVGHALRRMLLSSIVGTAVTAVRVQGVKHEFMSLRSQQGNKPCVMQEDIIDVILNLKQLALTMDHDGVEKLTIDEVGPKTVTAADLKLKKGVELVNPDLVLAHLNEGGHLKMELEVELGRGYRPVEKRESSEIGRIPVDAAFSPVRKVHYQVVPTRVGQMTDFDKLVLEVWTNGAISPKAAIAYAAKILKEHLQILITFEEIDDTRSRREELTPEEQKILELLDISVDELDLTVRSSNCLRGINVGSLGELVVLSEPELIKARNFGAKSMTEIKDKIKEYNLRLGMKDEIADLRARARKGGQQG